MADRFLMTDSRTGTASDSACTMEGLRGHAPLGRLKFADEQPTIGTSSLDGSDADLGPDGGIRAMGKPRARSVVFAVLKHQLHSEKKQETTRVSSFALYRTRVDQNFDDAGNKLGAGAATGSPFRLSAIDPSETVQAVGDTPETHRTNASRGSEANGYDRFLFLNTMFRWATTAWANQPSGSRLSYKQGTVGKRSRRTSQFQHQGRRPASE
ncbi:hypothetical protein KCU73_g129, partial [Aureobasidium melanogenum]